MAHIQVPIPRSWLAAAQLPRLRLVVCWHPPVNAAVPELWACRKVSAQVRSGIGNDAPRGKGKGHVSYPVIDRTYELPDSWAEAITEDACLVDLSYEDIAEYPVSQEFSPRQRVAFAAELFDEGESDVQAAVQELPITATLNMLSASATLVTNPVLVKVR